MLAELAAANAAFAIIKKTVANSQDLFRAGKAISDFVNAEEDLKKRGERKKNSFWLKVGGKDASDLEEFMALEEIKKKRQAIEQAMIYYGRPGLHSDWVKFQAEARKRRLKEQADRLLRRKQLLEILAIATLIFFGGVLVIYFAFFIALATKG